ncbi:hypothetical protein ACFVUS_12630 [Nocardia sp. NPDC058058]|uniref:hypothetical protein n=1 Tax=Nocardia sp. NPDC058058 TaxID=3346317 RepID=UPI0036DDC74E
MTENNEVQQVRSVDDVLRGGGGPPVFPFEEVGTKVTGTLKSAEMVKVIYPKDHPKAGQHKTYESGRLAYQIKLVLTDTTAKRTDDEDDGTRRTFVKEFGPNRDAFSRALDERGFAVVAAAYGSRLTIERIADGPKPFKGASPEHLFRFEFNSADIALGDRSERAKEEPARKETREDSKPKSTRDLLRENGLDENLAAMLPDNAEDVQPELLQALKNQKK